MPRIVLCTGAIETVASDSVASFDGFLTVENAAVNVEEGSIEIDETAARAGVARWRKAGARVFVDQGSGTLEQIPPAELGESIEISESLEGSADTLTFSRAGDSWSPFLVDLIRARRPMSATLVYGAPGDLYSADVFDGYFTSSSFQIDPPVSHLTCLDAAILYSEKLVSINEPANHGKSRYDILREHIVAGLGIPLGDVSLPENGYAALNKPLVVGEERVLEFLKKFFAPCGARVYFSDGRLNIVQDSFTEESVKSINLCDLTDAAINVEVPDVAATNRVVSVAVKYDSRTPTGDRTLEKRIEASFAFYAPRGAIASQSVTGVLTTGMDLSGPYNYQEVSRIETTDTLRGATIVRSQIDEFAWFSPQTCRLQQLFDGSLTHKNTANGVFTSFYQYADGSWHVEPCEQYRLVRRTIIEKDIDEDGNVVAITEELYDYHWIRRAVAEMVGGVETPMPTTIPITEDGEGMVLACQIIGIAGEGPVGPSFAFAYPTTRKTTTFELDAQGFINRETTVSEFDSDGQKASATAEGTFIYNRDSKRYTNREWEQSPGMVSFGSYGGRVTLEKTYTITGPDSYRLVETTTDINAGAVGGFDDRSRKTSTGTGARPHAETIENESQSQEMRVTVEDEVRVLLNGEQVSQIQSEYCEDEVDLLATANFAIREAAAFRLPIEIYLEGLLHKGQWVDLTIARRGIVAQMMLIEELKRQIPSFRQPITLLWYPAEVR